LPLHCGWDGQFKGNARGIKAHKIDEEMNQHTNKINLPTMIELEQNIEKSSFFVLTHKSAKWEIAA